MTSSSRDPISDLRGASRLAVEATRGVTDVVEAMHRQIAGGPAIFGRPLDGVIGAILGLAYGSVRGVTSVVGAGLDQALAALAPTVDATVPGPAREAVLGALNGVIGDHLEATHNPLAIQMTIRSQGRPLELTRAGLAAALPEATGKVLVLVHGSSMNDLQWRRNGHDHGGALQRDLGYTPVYLHYNSGLHISTNGRQFAHLLESLLQEWPVPVESLDLVTHSMGGLVSRSALHVATDEHLQWPARLRKLVFLGTPHHGAPLERGGHLFELALGVSDYSLPIAKLARLRGAGVTDLRHGNLRDEDWQGKDAYGRGHHPPAPLPLPPGVTCFAAAASLSKAHGKRLAGDGLVTVDSALGRHTDPARTLDVPAERQWIGLTIGHLDLLDRPEVYATLRGWLSGDGEASATERAATTASAPPCRPAPTA